MADPTKSVFDDVRMRAGDSARSYQWYQKQVQALKGKGSIRANQLMRADQENLVTRIIPGQMYLFYYDPKHKEKLPYYDTLPLVLPYRRVAGGFFGVNLHYLPYLLRFRVLGELSKYATDDKMDDNTKIRISYRLLNQVALLRPAKECVKHYLDDHVRSRFLRINIQDWLTASQLPIERFVGSNKQQIWRDTRKRYQ